MSLFPPSRGVRDARFTGRNQAKEAVRFESAEVIEASASVSAPSRAGSTQYSSLNLRMTKGRIERARAILTALTTSNEVKIPQLCRTDV